MFLTAIIAAVAAGAAGALVAKDSVSENYQTTTTKDYQRRDWYV